MFSERVLKCSPLGRGWGWVRRESESAPKVASHSHRAEAVLGARFE
jgi:hypothetical protein